MSRKSKYNNDWLNRREDRKKSIELNLKQIQRLKTIGSKKAEKSIGEYTNNSELSFGKYEDKVNTEYRKNILNTEYILFDGLNEKIDVTAENTYKDIASILLEAKENKGIYIVLCWPAGVEWPLFIQTIANSSILKITNYEKGIKVAIYPATTRSIARGRHIRVSRKKLIDEAKEAYEKGKLNSRHHAYFALNDFDQDKTGNIRQNPSVIDLNPIFEFTEDSKWSLVGGGYFKDIYTYMFNISGNTRRPVIDDVASVLNDPFKTQEGVFLLSPKVSPKNAVNASLHPINTDALIVDGREKILESLGVARDTVQTMIESWVNLESKNSIVLLLDSPKVYQRTVFQVIETFRKFGLEKNIKEKFHRYSFLRLKTTLFESYSTETFQSIKTLNDLPDPPSLKIVGLTNYIKMANLYKIANKVEPQDRGLCRNMLRAIGFIDRIISLPVSQSELLDWLRELTQNWSEADANRIFKKYIWKSYKREWLRNSESSSLVASIDEFLRICDDLEQHSNQKNEITELVLDQLIESQGNRDANNLILVKEKRIAEFVKDLIEDVKQEGDDFNVDVDVFSSIIEPNLYNRILILGLKHSDFKEIVFWLPIAKDFTKVYVSAPIAFKIEREINILLELGSFENAHNRLLSLKEQITPILDSIRHLGVPREFSFPDSYGDSYDYDYEYSSFANIYLSNKQVLDVGKETTIIKWSENMFLATNVEQLEEGDWIVPMDGFIEELESRMGKNLSVSSNQDDALLKSYFNLAKQNIAKDFDYKTRTKRSKNILKVMQSINPEVCKNIHIGMLNRWLKNIEEYEESIEDLLTKSAKNKESYLLFAKAIKIPEKLAEMFWENGIKAKRVAHIQEGRGVSAKIKHILIGTMSGEQLGLSEENIGKLQSLAKERLCRVEMISPCEIDNME